MILITSCSTFIKKSSVLLNNNKIILHSNTNSWITLLPKDESATNPELVFGRQNHCENHCDKILKSKYKVFGVLECSGTHGPVNNF